MCNFLKFVKQNVHNAATRGSGPGQTCSEYQRSFGPRANIFHFARARSTNKNTVSPKGNTGPTGRAGGAGTTAGATPFFSGRRPQFLGSERFSKFEIYTSVLHPHFSVSLGRNKLGKPIHFLREHWNPIHFPARVDVKHPSKVAKMRKASRGLDALASTRPWWQWCVQKRKIWVDVVASMRRAGN